MTNPAPREEIIANRLSERTTVADVVKFGSAIIEDPEAIAILRAQKTTSDAIKVCLENGVSEVLLRTLTDSEGLYK